MKIVSYPFVKRPESYYYEFIAESPGHQKSCEYFSQELETEVFNWPMVTGRR
jgi:hypothetical protein